MSCLVELGNELKDRYREILLDRVTKMSVTRKKKIRSSQDLPSWFKLENYKKQPTPTEWYREILARVEKLRILNSDEDLLETMSEADRIKLADDFVKMPSKDEGDYQTPYYKLPLTSHVSTSTFSSAPLVSPVQPLSTMEALYLSAARTLTSKRVEEAQNKLEALLRLWQSAKVWSDNSSSSESSLSRINPEYEQILSAFLKDVKELPTLKQPATLDFPPYFFTPYLSYGQPLAGYPVTIDTRYDDATIVRDVKRWLAEIRKKTGQEQKRAFDHLDYAEWEDDRFREICDLDMWSRISGIRINDQVVADAVWPTGRRQTSSLTALQKTVRPNVDALFTHTVVTRLYSQLVFEIGENFLEHLTK